MRRGGLARDLGIVRELVRAGVFRPRRPDRALRAAGAWRRWGTTPAAGYAVSAALYPSEPAIVDELGTLTFREVHRRTNALARAFAADGIGPGDGVALMCRNHRGIVETVIACGKLGADVLFLNTGFSAPQLADVLRREAPRAIVLDEEFASLVPDEPAERLRYLGWCDDPASATLPRLEDMVRGQSAEELVAPAGHGRVIILTSGTTGTPKGAVRPQPGGLAPLAALLARLPLRARDSVVIAAPMFHAWGYAIWTMGLALSQTVVLSRRFDAEATLAAIERERAGTLCVVPIMLTRMLELPRETIARYDLSSLRIIAASGSALPAALCLRAREAFGDVLYNYYGSTEVAWAAIANPDDLRAAPGTVGRPPPGTVVRLLGDDDGEVAAGESGRIFVGNEMLFTSYTGGGGKPRVGNLVSTGDVGHVDAAGRLFVDGRDDEMIVSGGENVFPIEVENLLTAHPAVREVAVVPVDDDQFGQRLRAVLVCRPGEALGEDDVREYVRANLARYKVPRDVVFVNELPRTASGKVLKRVLVDADAS